MRSITRSITQLCLIISIMLPMPSAAMNAITCHCFTDRSYDPDRPAVADPYFLAATQNSFFAGVFNVEKKTIVLKKQQGIPSDDLWIVYWIASQSGTQLETLFQAKKGKEAWKDVVALLRISSKTLGSRFANALNSRASTAHLAEAVVDELFIRHQLMGDKELATIRQAGATNQDLIIATLIAAKTRQSAKYIYLEVKNGSKTWGSLLQVAKIDTKNLQMEVSTIFKLKP